MGRSWPEVPGVISMPLTIAGFVTASNLRCSLPSAAGEMSLKARMFAALAPPSPALSHWCGVGLDVQRAGGGWRDGFESPDVRRAGSHLADDIELVQDLAPIGKHRKNAPGLAAAGHIIFAVERLRKVEAHFVIAGRQRNLIGKGALPSGLIQSRIAGADDGPATGLKNVSAGEITVAPQIGR